MNQVRASLRLKVTRFGIAEGLVSALQLQLHILFTTVIILNLDSIINILTLSSTVPVRIADIPAHFTGRALAVLTGYSDEMILLLTAFIRPSILKRLLILSLIEALEATRVRFAHLSCVLSRHHQVHGLVGGDVGHLEIITLTLVHIAALLFNIHAAVIAMSDMGHDFASGGVSQVGLKITLDIPRNFLKSIRSMHVRRDIGRAICHKFLHK